MALFKKRIPLAWLQLTHEKIRLLVAIAGIAFADILMFMQMGFQDGLFTSATRFHNSVQGDIFLMSPQSTALISLKSFSQRRLYQALSYEGVTGISPIYLGKAIWRNPQKPDDTRGIFVFAFNPVDRTLFNLPGVGENLDKITYPDTYIFDTASRAQFGPIPQLFREGKEVSTEIQNRKITIGGLFTLGASFGADGNIITSDTNFIRAFRRPKGDIDIGVIHVREGQDIKVLAKVMADTLPKDVRVFTKAEFVDYELKYWQTGTAIGFIFTLGTIMGFVVGIVIVYQILYTDVADHLPEYATLKAIGYTDGYLLKVVFTEAVLLSIVGFFPSLGVASILYNLTRNATNLPIMMTLARAITVFILTFLMCTISGAIAVRKLSAADPADVF
jgi:putative ABC transport system permease protein